MKSFLIFSLFAIIGIVSGTTFYTRPTPAQWAAYKTAASGAGMVERSLNISSLTFQRRFAVIIPFAPDDCRLGARNSAVATSLTNSFSGSGCSVINWNDIRLSCYAIANVQCQTITQFTTQLNNNAVLRLYGKSVYHHFIAPSDRLLSRPSGAAKRDVKRQVSPPEDLEDPFYSKNNTEQNRQLGLLIPESNGKWWHYSAVTQNNKPFDTSSSPGGHRYPIYKGNGKFYTIGLGLDLDHPEFSNTNQRSVEVDQSFVDWPFDINDQQLYCINNTNQPKCKRLINWIGKGDQSGHETATVAMAAGKTLGVLPKADIYLYQIQIFYAGCWLGDIDERYYDLWPAWDPSGFCGDSYSPPAWVSAVNHASVDNENRRLSGAGAGVFSSSQLFYYDDCNKGPDSNCQKCLAEDCGRDLINSIRNAIAKGLIYVNAAGNHGIEMTVAGAMAKNMLLQMYEITEVVWVGGYDINYQQAKYRNLGYDDTNYLLDELYPPATEWNPNPTPLTGSSNYGKEVDFWAPSKDFPFYAATSRRPGPAEMPGSFMAKVGTPNDVWVPYQQSGLAQGTSYAAPIVAAGLLGYATQLPSTLSGREFVERTVEAADKWAGRADLGQYVNGLWSPVTNPDKIVRMFRLIPTDNSADCPN